MLRSLTNSFVALILSLSVAHCYNCYSNAQTEYVWRLANSLRRSLEYVKNNKEARTTDVALGVALAKGNLRWIERQLVAVSADDLVREIRQLSQLSDRIFHHFYDISHKFGSREERSFWLLLKTSFQDILAEDLKPGPFHEKLEFHFPRLRGCSTIARYVMKGTPIDSDACISELYENSCNVSRSCWDQETSKREHAGYKTSHRLLYLQMAEMLHCSSENARKAEEMEIMKESLCRRMLAEAIFLERVNLKFARDLFLEEIALCGFEGYLRFARKWWVDKIMEWQHESGCFGLLPGERRLSESCSGDGWPDRRKRNDSVVKGVCHTHITAAAISALAFSFRVFACHF